ncbi:hypothetical protein CK203_035660 [Vitis vinifera]|uniref:Integrase catalytic domain-containing protein n=1 Tax=Vitis vinifera TaxID=29760 RepID=A0A438ICV4_VITVI|nr:hypothetical protein CK203_035660 [Vitis vinifera]
MFGVSMIDSDDVTLYDACTDAMDMIGTSRILDVFPPGPRSAFDVFRISMLEFDGDELVATDITHDTVSIEGASDSVDPPFSFDTMFEFVTRFDDISDAPTTHVCDVDDVGDTDDPLSDFWAPDQPRELRIGSSLSPDERSRLIDLLRSYLDVFAWSYEDMSGLDPTIVKEEIQKQLNVGFLSVVEYPEWLANVVHVPKRTTSTVGHSMLSFMDGFSGYNQIVMAPEDIEKISFITKWGTNCYRVMPFGLKNVGATYQRAATTLFHDMMHKDVKHAFEKIKECLLSPPVLVLPHRGGLYLCTCLFQTWLGMHFDIQYVTQKSVKGSIVVDHLASLPVSDARPIDNDFPNEQFVSVTSIVGWRLYFDGAANHLGSGDCTRPWSQTVGDPRGFQLGYSTDLGAENQFADALATLASMIEIPVGVTVRSLLIETRPAPAYYCLIGDIEDQDELPEADCCQFVQRCPECQMHGDLIHMPPSKLHVLTSPWPFSMWGIDVIGKISPKSSNRHEYILVVVDYFTKWVEATSYARLKTARVAKFIRGEVDTLIQEYGIQHHRSSTYRPQTNGAIEAANKNIKRILRKMVKTSQDWSEKLPFSLWAYRTSFRTSTETTPYSLVCGMEAVLPVEIEMGSLRIALEQQISETGWAQSVMTS